MRVAVLAALALVACESQPLEVVLLPDLTTAFRGEPEVVVLAGELGDAEVAALIDHISLRTLEDGVLVPADIEHLPPVSAGLVDHRFVLHVGSLQEGWYVLEVTEAAPADGRRGFLGASARFRVGSGPVVQRLTFAGSTGEVGMRLHFSERLDDARPLEELFALSIAGGPVPCTERDPALRVPPFDHLDFRCAAFDLDQDVTVRPIAELRTIIGTSLEVGPLGREGAIVVSPVRDGLVGEEAVVFDRGPPTFTRP